eukprot:scaffold1331_cov119-Isochrysis_galbana.AAC.1
MGRPFTLPSPLPRLDRPIGRQGHRGAGKVGGGGGHIFLFHARVDAGARPASAGCFVHSCTRAFQTGRFALASPAGGTPPR